MALKLFNDSGVAKLQAKDGEESITATADGDVKLYYDNAEKLATTSAGVDVTGNLDVNANGGGGTTALHLNKNDTSGYYIVAEYDGTLASNRTYTLKPPSSDSSSEPFIWSTGNAHSWEVDGSEVMRIDGNGQLLVGKTVDSYATTGIKLGDNGRMQVSSAVSDDNIALDKDVAGNLMYFSVSTVGVGTIYTNGSSTSYNTSSDYRLKDNVNYSFDATTRLKQLKPCRFNFITDVNTTVDGFLAHEVSQVVPEAVTGTKDATKQQDIINEDGEVIGTETVPDYQGIDQAKLVPLLVATIQELEARITALEAGV